MAADKGVPKVAPAAPAAPDRVQVRVLAASATWFRIARALSDPKGFSTDPGNRYSSPRVPGGFLYCGDSPNSCFWEVFWDSLQTRVADELLLDERKLSERVLIELRCTRELRVFDASSAGALKRLGANTVGCFNGDYGVCRAWAAHVFESAPSLDGILFPASRSGAGMNLALFGGRVKPAELQLSQRKGSLLSQKCILDLLVTERIGLLD
jgi:hypothetical protein